MADEATELLKRALTLPVAERAELAGSLIESLDEAADESVKAAWNEEVARRMEDLDSGKVKPISLEEARRRLPQLSNDRMAALLASGGCLRGRGSGALVPRT